MKAIQCTLGTMFLGGCVVLMLLPPSYAAMSVQEYLVLSGQRVVTNLDRVEEVFAGILIAELVVIGLAWAQISAAIARRAV